MPLLRSALLKAEPAGSLASLDELFALANAMEQEAATRYAQLAEEMARQGKSALATVFNELAAAEREHVDSVQRWSQSRRGKAPDPSLVRWEAPATLDSDETVEIRGSKLMTPYRALAMAVRNEERAFAFWSYLAAFAKDPEIKRAAESMASEELGHVAMLRKARRRAYRQELRLEPDRAGGTMNARPIDAAFLERQLASQLQQLESGLDAPHLKRIRELADEARLMSHQAGGFGQFPAGFEERDAETIAEALTDAYLEGAEASDDPARLELFQALASRSIARLAWLRSLAA